MLNLPERETNHRAAIDNYLIPNQTQHSKHGKCEFATL